jgi:hypothetical protein
MKMISLQMMRMKMSRVIIEVEGGIAYVVECPPDVEVIINDLD